MVSVNRDFTDVKGVTSVLQIGRDSKDNLGIIIHSFPSNIFCEPSIEPSR